MINSICGDVTREFIYYIYNQFKLKKNKRKIKYITETLTVMVFEHFKPYLYTILSLLVIMFIINIFQFYYYIKLFISNNNVLHTSI